MSSLQEFHYHLFSSSSSLSSLHLYLHFGGFILSWSFSSSSYSPSLFHFLPTLFLFSRLNYYYLLVHVYPPKSHPSGLLTQLHHDEHGKGQEKPLDGRCIFGNPSTRLTGIRMASFCTLAPFSAHAPCYHPPAQSDPLSQQKLLCSSTFCSKSQPYALRAEVRGVEKGSLGCRK